MTATDQMDHFDDDLPMTMNEIMRSKMVVSEQEDRVLDLHEWMRDRKTCQIFDWDDLDLNFDLDLDFDLMNDLWIHHFGFESHNLVVVAPFLMI